jgi:hypothetical protein
VCTLTPAYCGKLPDPGDGTRIYVHGFHGFAIHTHRTVRTSPAGWVFGVYDENGQYTYGYEPTQRQALQTAAHFIAGPCSPTKMGVSP